MFWYGCYLLPLGRCWWAYSCLSLLREMIQSCCWPICLWRPRSELASARAGAAEPRYAGARRTGRPSTWARRQTSDFERSQRTRTSQPEGEKLNRPPLLLHWTVMDHMARGIECDAASWTGGLTSPARTFTMVTTVTVPAKIPVTRYSC